MDKIRGMGLETVNCCATCVWRRGWFDNMWCGKHRIEAVVYTICPDFVRERDIPPMMECLSIGVEGEDDRAS